MATKNVCVCVRVCWGKGKGGAELFMKFQVHKNKVGHCGQSFLSHVQ